ncbi:MAG: hypothetical protein KIS94_11085 [Chitinophagales bacterium]|nr:hypothetical protein [Chitinophagales bacterium]
MRFIVILLFLPLLTTASAPQETKPFKRVEVAYSFSPMVTYRWLTKNSFGPNSFDAAMQKEIMRGRNKREVEQFGFITGARARVNVVKYFAIESGVEYYLHRYMYKGDLFYLTTFNGSALDTVGTYKANYLYNYHYLKIPVAFTFTAGKGKFRAVFSFGTGLDVFLKLTQTTKSVMNGVKKTMTETSSEPFVKFNLTPFAGIGFEYAITGSMKIRVLPFAQMQALKNIDAPITERLWGGGVNLSFSYGFIDVKNRE